MLPESVCADAETIFNFAASGHVDAPGSHIWAGTVTGLLALLFLISTRKRISGFRKAAQANALVNADAPLEIGNRFIRGTVEYAEGSELAVAVHVEQTGKEVQHKGKWSHSWKETDRQTHAVPFYVRCANGERVRVEPGSDVLLVDEPDHTVLKEKTLRTRIAELTAGETVIVEGVLIRGPDPEARGGNSYRDNTTGWVMRPARGEQMHLSAEDLGVRHEIRAKDYDSTGAVLRFLAVFIQLFFLTYHARNLLGTDSCAQVISKDTYVTKSKNSSTTHYRVWLDVPGTDWGKLDRELDRDDYKKIDKGSILAFRRVNVSAWLSMPGYGSSLHSAALVAAIVFALIGVGAFTGTVYSRRWYEGRLDDAGSGRLPEPRRDKPSEE